MEENIKTEKQPEISIPAPEQMSPTPEAPKLKSKFKPLIIVISGLLIAIIGYVVIVQSGILSSFSKKDQSFLPDQLGSSLSPTPDPYANLKKYEDPNNLFSFMYPSGQDLKISQSKNPSSLSGVQIEQTYKSGTSAQSGTSGFFLSIDVSEN